MDPDPAVSAHDARPVAFLDVTGMPLDQLLASPDSVLARSLHALVDDVARPQEILSAFGNFAPDDSPVPTN